MQQNEACGQGREGTRIKCNGNKRGNKSKSESEREERERERELINLLVTFGTVMVKNGSLFPKGPSFFSNLCPLGEIR